MVIGFLLSLAVVMGAVVGIAAGRALGLGRVGALIGGCLGAWLGGAVLLLCFMLLRKLFPVLFVPLVNSKRNPPS